MDWIDLAQDRDRWQAHVNEVWTLGFHSIGSKFIKGQLEEVMEMAVQ